MLRSSWIRLACLAVAIAVTQSNGAFATIVVTDSNADGSFGTVVPDDITYGDGTMQAVVTPLLFISQLKNTQPAAVQLLGTKVNYAYSVSGSGSSAVSLDYTFTSARGPSDIPTTLTDLRFMLDVVALGADQSLKKGVVTQSWPAAAIGDPSARQVQDLNTGALLPMLQSNNAVTDNKTSPSCLTSSGCVTDFGLEWDRPSLAPGDSWTVHVSLVDNSALVSGGRWLKTTSVDVADNVLIVGDPTLVPEPETYGILVLGGTLLVVCRRCRRAG